VLLAVDAAALLEAGGFLLGQRARLMRLSLDEVIPFFL
jgi:hypothetical protein